MPSLLGCCCQPNGGCNGWWTDPNYPPQEPSTGFETGDVKELNGTARCTRPDGTDCGVEDDPKNCCGPAVPGAISVTATTWWDFMWSRQKFGLTCQGGPLAPDDPPEPIPHCGQQTWTVWEGEEGWTWVEGGGLNVTLVRDNEAALAAGDWSSGEMRPSCCAHYYYGTAFLGGPSRPAFSDNPWGYESHQFTCSGGSPQTQYSPPSSLRAYCRMVLTFKGEGPNGHIPFVQPRIFLQAKLEIYFALDGFTSGSTGADHWIDGITNGNLPEDVRVGVAELYGSASVDVRACNCTGIGEVGDDAGVNVMDKIDWGLQPTGAYWNYAWPHPTVWDDSDTSHYGSVGSGSAPCGTGSGQCTAETFTLQAYSCCTNANPATCPDSPPPSNCWPQVPHCRTVANIYNHSRRRHGLHCWSTADDRWADGYRKRYDGSQYGHNDDTSWHCWEYATANPCQNIRDCPLSTVESIATARVKGGFVSNAPIFFPNPGLRDFMIGVGDGDPV